MADFFSFTGRVRRCTFWINALLCGVITVVLFALFVRISIDANDFSSALVITNAPIYYILSFIVGVRVLSVSVRRWHDVDKSGWWSLTGLIGYLRLLFPGVTITQVIVVLLLAVVGIYALIMQGFMSGDDGANDYGPEPAEGQWL